MAAAGTQVLGQTVGRYTETDTPQGRLLPQTLGHYLWLPMAVMGIMLVFAAFGMGIARSQLSVDLSEDGTIYVSGFAEHRARRVGDFLKAEAQSEIAPRARAKAAVIEREIRRIGIRHMTSRWGSCGRDGALCFCWRLILAPEAVLDSVVAHEVTHLRYMSHGPRFWALVARLTPDAKGARAWLKAHGDTLLAYG